MSVFPRQRADCGSEREEDNEAHRQADRAEDRADGDPGEQKGEDDGGHDGIAISLVRPSRSKSPVPPRRSVDAAH
jgi:hypothetical protein